MPYIFSKVYSFAVADRVPGYFKGYALVLLIVCFVGIFAVSAYVSLKQMVMD